jgi:hypothetical protein
MAWTTLPTLTDGQVLTGAHMAAFKGNIEETAAAKSNTAGGYFVSTGLNTLAQRIAQVDSVAALETTTVTTYGPNLSTPGPAVTVQCGSSALVALSARMYCSSAGNGARMSYAISSPTSAVSNDLTSLGTVSGNVTGGIPEQIASFVTLVIGITPGTNTFTCQYKAVNGGTATFGGRRIAVMPL